MSNMTVTQISSSMRQTSWPSMYPHYIAAYVMVLISAEHLMTSLSLRRTYALTHSSQLMLKSGCRMKPCQQIPSNHSVPLTGSFKDGGEPVSRSYDHSVMNHMAATKSWGRSRKGSSRLKHSWVSTHQRVFRSDGQYSISLVRTGHCQDGVTSDTTQQDNDESG